MKTVGSVSKIIENIEAEEIFKIWSDVDNWHRFNHGIISAKLENEFKVGDKIILKLPNDKIVKLTISEITQNKSFTDVTNFPFAKMYGMHKIIKRDNKIEIIASVKIEGLLGFLWEKLIARKVASKIEDDLNSLIKLVKNEKKE